MHNADDPINCWSSMASGVPLQDTYQRLTFKTVALWKAVSTLYNVTYVVKVDDDSYVWLDRLGIAAQQWMRTDAGDRPARMLCGLHGG